MMVAGHDSCGETVHANTTGDAVLSMVVAHSGEGAWTVLKTQL